jgi:anthranilate phosphoribosyltransferase
MQMAMDVNVAAWFPEALATLLDRRDLTDEQMHRLMQDVLSGGCGELETGAILVAMRCKGESAAEIAAAARVLRAQMLRLDTGGREVLDTSGTGGDGAGTFNISTAAALVVAAAGVPVVKHGNRAVSGTSGSADVLRALGLSVEAGPDWARRCLEEAGFAFCLAPHYHPALAQVAAIRRRLGVRTLFNCLGPMLNPAGAPYQLIGVGRPEWLDPVAGALARLGSRHALLVYSRDGLDEVSLSAPTLVREVREHTVKAREWSSDDFGLARCAASELRVRSVEESARVIRSVLAGEKGAARRIVLANAAAALVAADRVSSLPAGLRLAADAIDDGRARNVLDRLIACSR